MADQKELKKRLKVLMQKPENQVCSDCPERQPRWASLIRPPPGSPPDSAPIGAFCCLECSGSHRRLGVHISFVRSINLDSWKEKEVLAMENGGNKKVNAIWEANLQRAGGRKPVTGADLTTRERYIRDKYERRRFYDPQALVEYQNSEPSFDEIGSKNHGGDFANFGPPPEAQVSDAARARAEKKKKKMPSRNRSFDNSTRNANETIANVNANSNPAARRRVKKQESAPEPVIDLLDMGAAPASAPSTSNGAANADFADFFSPQAANAVPTPTLTAPTGETPKRKGSRDAPNRSRSNNRDNMRTKSKTPDREKSRKNQQQDILNMYNTPAANPQPMMHPNNGTNNQVNMNGINMMAMMQQMQQMNMNPQAQQQPQQQMGPGIHNMTDSTAGKHNSRLAMHQNLMMQQVMQQQQQNVQQMQRMMMQQQGSSVNPQNNFMMPAALGTSTGANTMGGMNPQNLMMPAGAMNPQMMQAMMNQNNNNARQMNPNMMMMMGVNPNMMQQQQQATNQMSAFGGMPMGAPANANNKNQMPEKEDPFAQFGMNAFR